MRGKLLTTAVVASMLAAGTAAAQTPPAEWRNAATALFARLDPASVTVQPAAHRSGAATAPQAAANGAELRSGYALARRWRQHNNGNTENILAEYLAFVQLCRTPGCTGETIGARGYLAWAQDVKAERQRYGSSEALVQAIHAWLEKVSATAGSDAARNLALVHQDLDQAAADFATTNIYTLGWLAARRERDEPAQAASFARFILFVYGQAWIGGQCVDIRRIAAVLDGPPQITACS
jgi:hypothetical protein